MKKKATKKSAPAKKAVEPKLKVVKKFEKEPIVKDVNALLAEGPVSPKPISKAEMKRQMAAAKKQADEFAKMMEKHQVAAKKKKDEDFNAAFKKAEDRIEIYYTSDKNGESMDMRVEGFKSRVKLAGVIALMQGKITQ
jgi:hypothetical protein